MNARTIDDRAHAREVREWARANGHTISDKGAIPRHITSMYAAATGADDDPAWNSSVSGPPDPLDGLEDELAGADNNYQPPSAATESVVPPPEGGAPLAPVTSLDEARERVGAAGSTRPAWAGPSPRARQHKEQPGKGKPVTRAVRDDITGKLALLLSPLAAAWQMADPYCGASFADNLDQIVAKSVPLICRSPAMVQFFENSTLIWALFELTIALQPVATSVVNHHVRRTVNEMGQRIDRQGRAYEQQQPRQGETVVADQSMYVTEVSGHVPPARPAG